MSENVNSFSNLALRRGLLDNLASLDYSSMTPIQIKSLPLMLEGQDVIAQAKTGSGKTAAFGLTLLNKLNVDVYSVQTLVMCPTRELAEQVCQALRRLARGLPNVKVLNLSGGMPLKPQLDSLRHGAHIIVGTPGRIQKHLSKETLSLKKITTLVLDEADRMLDMGFIDAIKEIIQVIPKQRQTLLFSATYPDGIKKLATVFMKNPQRVVIEEQHTQMDIEQYFYAVDSQKNKYAILKNLLLEYQPESALIFCNTKQETVDVSMKLNKDGFSSIALNGDLEQYERDQAMIRFVNGSAAILVATDVAARGLDIKDLAAVVNYDIAFEPEAHTHRIGRTARAGKKGLALSLALPFDAERIALLEENLAFKACYKTAIESVASLNKISKPTMVTLCINVGKKDKIRPGDILGALTKDAGIPGDSIGKIDIAPLQSHVAIARDRIDMAYHYFLNGAIKGRKVKVKKM